MGRLAKNWVGGRCGNEHIIFEEDIMRAATKAVFSTLPDVNAIDPELQAFEEWWSFDGSKSVKQGHQGGCQRMRSKHEAQLQAIASKLVRVLKYVTEYRCMKS